MCLLILIRNADPEYPLIVASNRDEHRARKAAPPGLFVGSNHRILSPRDRATGGTWMALSASGMFAAITNLAGVPPRAVETSRGELPHLAVDQSSVSAAVDAVRARCTEAAFQPFQLVVADRHHARALVAVGDAIQEVEIEDPVAVLSNEHRLGELKLPANLSGAGGFRERIADLKRILQDEGELTGHRILKKGGDYGTVSSAILAIPKDDLTGLEWWYAPGEPDVAAYRNYGNLVKRLGV